MQFAFVCLLLIPCFFSCLTRSARPTFRRAKREALNATELQAEIRRRLAQQKRKRAAADHAAAAAAAETAAAAAAETATAATETAAEAEAPAKADAAEASRELDALEKEAPKGQLSPSEVVEAADALRARYRL